MVLFNKHIIMYQLWGNQCATAYIVDNRSMPRFMVIISLDIQDELYLLIVPANFSMITCVRESKMYDVARAQLTFQMLTLFTRRAIEMV